MFLCLLSIRDCESLKSPWHCRQDLCIFFPACFPCLKFLVKLSSCPVFVMFVLQIFSFQTMVSRCQVLSRPAPLLVGSPIHHCGDLCMISTPPKSTPDFCELNELISHNYGLFIYECYAATFDLILAQKDRAWKPIRLSLDQFSCFSAAVYDLHQAPSFVNNPLIKRKQWTLRQYWKLPRVLFYLSSSVTRPTVLISRRLFTATRHFLQE